MSEEKERNNKMNPPEYKKGRERQSKEYGKNPCQVGVMGRRQSAF